MPIHKRFDFLRSNYRALWDLKEYKSGTEWPLAVDVHPDKYVECEEWLKSQGIRVSWTGGMGRGVRLYFFMDYDTAFTVHLGWGSHGISIPRTRY